MKKRFEVELSDEKAKLLLIDHTGKDSLALVTLLSGHFSKNLETYILTKKKHAFLKGFLLSSLTSHFLQYVAHDLDYICILLGSAADNKEVLAEIEKLKKSCKKIILLVSRNEMRDVSFFHQLIGQDSVQVVFFGQLFGKHFPESAFTQAILNIDTNKKIEIFVDPISPLFVISEDDFLSGLDYLFYARSIRGEASCLYYQSPQDFITFVNLLKRIDQEIWVEYVGSNRNKGRVQLGQDFEKRIPLKYIDHVFVGFERSAVRLLESGVSISYGNKNYLLSKKKHKVFRFLGRSFLFVFASFFLYIVLSVLLVFLSVFFFQQSVKDFESGKLAAAGKSIQTTKTLYFFGKPGVLALSYPTTFAYGSYLTNYAEVYEQTQDVVSDLVDISKRYADGSVLSPEDASTLIADIFFLYFLEKDFSATHTPIFQNSAFEKYLPLLEIAKTLAGFERELYFLVLFQNNTELRPTGGFIGSVAHISVRNGELKIHDIYDVYDIDGQLVDHNEPHFVIRRFLQPHLYLRDSNFNPDFEKSASTAAYLYNEVTGQQVDAVIAVDTEVLKKLVEVSGPIMVPGQKEALTAENIINVIHSSIHDNFFPGSTEKKELLSKVLSSLIISLEGDTKKQITLLKELPSLLLKKHVLIAFEDDSIQKGIRAAGISGNISETEQKTNVLSDVFSISEANIGVNKINKFVNRSVSYAGYFDQGKLSTTATVHYENKGKENYTMFFRVVVPKQVLLEKVTIDGVSQTLVPFVSEPVFFERPGFTPPEGLEVSEEEISQTLKTIGFRVVVLASSKKDIRLEMERNLPENLPATFTYALSYIKQPGTLPYPFKIVLQTSDLYKKANSNPVLFDGEILSDLEVSEKIQKVSSQ